MAITAFRPLTDTPAAVALARDCRLLFQDRLAHQPGLVLLERDAIDLVAREQSFGKAGAFWAGSYLLDGTVEPTASDAAATAITLRLAPVAAGEAKSFTTRGPRAELPRLVTELTAQAAAALRLRAASATELKAEAQRHLDESRQLAAVGLLLAAHRAAETAAAPRHFGQITTDGATQIFSFSIGCHRLRRITGFSHIRRPHQGESTLIRNHENHPAVIVLQDECVIACV